MEGKSMFNKDTYKYKPILLLLSVFIFILLSPLISKASPYEIDEDGVILFRYSEEPSFMKTTPLTGENDSSELDNNLGHSPVGHGETPEPGFWEWVQNTIKDFFSGEKDEKEESSWWDRVTNGVGNFFESVGDFFGSVGEWASDIWDGLSDWTKDLIVTIGIIAAVVVGVVAVVVLSGVAVVVGVVAGAVAIVGGVTYFLLYGGTEKFNAFHSFLWTLGGAITGGFATAGFLAMQASGALAALLNLGKIKLVEMALSSRIYFWIANSFRAGLANTVSSWLSTAGSLFLRFSTSLYLTGMRVLTALTGWLNVARLGVLRFATNMHLAVSSLLTRFGSFVTTQLGRFSGFIGGLWSQYRGIVGQLWKAYLFGATPAFIIQFINLYSDPENFNLFNALMDMNNAGLVSAFTFKLGGIWRTLSVGEKFKWALSIFGVGAGLDVIREQINSGDVRWGDAIIGGFTNLLAVRLAIWLVPETKFNIFTTSINTGIKFITDSFGNRIKDIIYWNDVRKQPNNLIKGLYTEAYTFVQYRYYELTQFLNNIDRILFEYLTRGYYRP